MRTLPAFLRDFLRAFSLVFVCASQECPHAGTFAIILWISVQFVWMFVRFSLLVFWRPRHFAWTLRTQFGAFFLRLGAQGHNVMKPVSQGTLNVRFERIQGSPLGQFWMHFC